jgi:hypothetical protein
MPTGLPGARNVNTDIRAVEAQLIAAMDVALNEPSGRLLHIARSDIENSSNNNRNIASNTEGISNINRNFASESLLMILMKQKVKCSN